MVEIMIPAHNSAIDGFAFCPPEVLALDLYDTLPDLIWPSDPGNDSPDLLAPIIDSNHLAVSSRTLLNPCISTTKGGGGTHAEGDFDHPSLDSFVAGSGKVLCLSLDVTSIFTETLLTGTIYPERARDVAQIDVSEEKQVPIVPVPGEDIVPQGNGPGVQGQPSFEPPQPPRHGGCWGFHVDMGANVHVTYFPGKLAHRVHSGGHCGTAGQSSMDVVCEGMWILQGTPSNFPGLHAVLTALGCPGGRQTSVVQPACSGYNCVHHVRSHVELTHWATNISYRLTCTTHCDTDFIVLMPCKTALSPQVYGEINAVDLAKTIKGSWLFHLLHLCLGCLGADILKHRIYQCLVQGLPIKVEIPDDFNCPICLRSKVKQRCIDLKQAWSSTSKVLNSTWTLGSSTCPHLEGSNHSW
jgi:hypothetical protein